MLKIRGVSFEIPLFFLDLKEEKMRRYLIRVPKYFGSQLDIEVEAMDETDAITIAKEYIETMAGRENLIQEWITCVGEVVDDLKGENV